MLGLLQWLPKFFRGTYDLIGNIHIPSYIATRKYDHSKKQLTRYKAYITPV